jgi:hypothetical protein
MSSYPYRPAGKSGGGSLLIGLVVIGGWLALTHGAAAGGGSVSAQSGPVTTVSQSSNVALGQRMAAAKGWTGGQWTCLDELWTKESGWRMVWNTAGSGAYGIPQSLPASKMASAGADYMTDPATQINWGLGYIEQTYGTPCAAWQHEEDTSPSWY